MSTLNAICMGICKTIQNYADAEVYVYQYMADVTNFPSVVCEPVQPQTSYSGNFGSNMHPTDFEGSFGRGSDMWYIGCYVLMPAEGNTEASQNMINQFITGCGPNSVRGIIHEHEDIGLQDTTAYCVGVSHYGAQYAFGGTRAVGALITIRVVTEASDANPFETN